MRVGQPKAQLPICVDENNQVAGSSPRLDIYKERIVLLNRIIVWNSDDNIQILYDVEENAGKTAMKTVVSRKRKLNLITDEEEPKEEISGECSPGVLMRQNAPSGEIMP